MYDKRSVSLFKCCIVQYIKHACKIVYSQLLYSKIKNIWNIYVLVMKYMFIIQKLNQE